MQFGRALNLGKAQARRAEFLLGSVPKAVSLVKFAQLAIVDKLQQPGIQFITQPLIAFAEIDDVISRFDRCIDKMERLVAVQVDYGNNRVLKGGVEVSCLV